MKREPKSEHFNTRNDWFKNSGRDQAGSSRSGADLFIKISKNHSIY